MTGEWRQLDPAYVSAQRLAGWIMFAIVGTAWALSAGLAWRLDTIGSWIDLGLAAAGAVLLPLLLWLATGWPALSYRYWGYRWDAGGIEIRSGVIVRRETTVPKSRVQHTDVSQGPLERRFGLGTLVIYTAGTEYARVVLPGLQHGLAMQIRDSLLPRSSDDAV